MSGRRRRGGEDHHEGGHADERWLVTYADMITLLMVLFIVLFAISQVDQQKYIALAEGLQGSFNSKPVDVSDGGQGVLAVKPAPESLLDIGSAVRTSVLPDLAQEMNTGASGAKDGAAAEAAVQMTKEAQEAVIKDREDLDRAQALIEKALAAAGLRSGVILRRDDRGLTVVVVNDLVFAADRAQVLPAGDRLLRAIAPALVQAGHDVQVEGHTNTVDVRPKYYPTEWELSSARASAVVRALVGLGMDPGRMVAAGLADTQPLVPASDPRSTRLNRRVAIVVLSAVTPQQAALTAQTPQPPS